MTVTVAALLAAKASSTSSSSRSNLPAAKDSHALEPAAAASSAVSGLEESSRSILNAFRVGRMGRRKQNCPQKTGLGPEAGATGDGPPGGPSAGGGDNENVPDDSEAAQSDQEEDEASVGSNLMQEAPSNEEEAAAEALELINRNRLSSPAAAQPSMNEEALANMLKSPLLNPALLSLNPSLYAVQLAQLQAAQQLLSHGAGLQQHLAAAASASPESSLRKRRLQEEEQQQQQERAMAAFGGLGVLNLSKSTAMGGGERFGSSRAESPLDLSGNQGLVSSSPRGSSGSRSPATKVPKIEPDAQVAGAAAKFAGMPAWAAAAASAGAFPFLNPFFAAGGADSMSAAAAAAAAQKFSLHSSAAASSPPPPVSAAASATSSEAGTRNPLDRMSEIAKTGGNRQGAPRHSAWQSQWINRGPENTKDIFKCVWCKDSFSTLQSLTAHMKETKHFGSALPPSPQTAMCRPPSSSSSSSPHLQQHHPPATPPPPPAPKETPFSRHQTSSPATRPSQTPPQQQSPAAQQKPPRDILKEQLPMPRKLVRGQDVWLGRGEQQTKDILKCMWCGESFRTLDLMTRHMQETKHYTKVISQEQLVSWKASEGGPPGAAGPSGPGRSSPASGHQSHVNSVLTCKVCEQSFSTLKDLSEHMVKNNHYKDQGKNNDGNNSGASSTATTPPSSAVAAPMGRPAAVPMASTSPALSTQQQTPKEKRKKSLPVRKLLELERAQQEMGGSELSKHTSSESTGKIWCEKCGDKILMHLFVDHIRQCVGPVPSPSASVHILDQRSQNAAAESSSPGVSPPPLLVSRKEEPKSILGSLEKMVQSNFGNKKKQGPETNLSILQRLGIDEGVDYSKPLVDPMAMFRNAHAQQGIPFPPISAASSMLAAGLAGFFAPGRGNVTTTITSQGVMVTEHGSSQTRSNSECSSPDRIKAELLAAGKAAESASVSPEPCRISLKSVSPVPSPSESSLTVDDTEKVVFSPAAAASSLPPSPAAATFTVAETDEDEAAGVTPPPLPQSVKVEDEERGEGSSEKKKKGKKKSHPLAALQMLCDKTEKTKAPSAAKNAMYGSPSDPGAILAFSWACNQAVVNDSLLKCPFCDTPFISKGAYRHHLSKMHFVKDGQMPDPAMFLAAKNAAAAAAAAAAGTSGGKGGGDGEGAEGETKEENAKSKFQKYSQLAKQLSCSATQP